MHPHVNGVGGSALTSEVGALRYQQLRDAPQRDRVASSTLPPVAGCGTLFVTVLAMKTVSLICLLAAIQFTFVPDSDAQSARQLTRKIVPPSNNPPPLGGAPASRPAPAPNRAVPPANGTNAVPAPPPPADPEKAKQETLKKTIEFEKKNAEKGSPWAQYSLGLRHLTGDGVEKDEAAARKWLEAAAKNNDSRAKKKLEELNEKKKK